MRLQAPRPGSRLRLVQVLLGVVWLVDGALQLQPAMFRRGFVTSVLLPSASGNPTPVASSITSMAQFLEPHIAMWNALFALTQLAIGAGLLLRRTVKPALVASFGWSLLVWVFSEGLGGLLTGRASPITGAPGAVLLYVLVGLVAWPRGHSGRCEPVSVVGSGLLGDAGARLAWAVLWVGSGLLLLQPANLTPKAVSDAVLGAAAGQPAWFSGVLSGVAGALGTDGVVLSAILAAEMAVIGVGVALRWHDQALMGAAVGVALLIWVFGEGLGGVLTGTGTDPNTGPLLILLALALTPSVGDRAGTDPRLPAWQGEAA